MSMNVTTVATSNTSGTTQVNNNSVDTSTKNSTESSFKDEMEKVSVKNETKDVKPKEEVKISKVSKEKDNAKNSEKIKDEINDGISSMINGYVAMNQAGTSLANDIERVCMLNSLNSSNTNYFENVSANSNKLTVSMSESDANFFISLTEHPEMNLQNITSQAQNLMDNGASVKEVKQNVQISQTLLDAIAKAKDSNQPLRIDFDHNMSVILRVSREGVVSANFIPGDKAVEQYLKNNINSLKATFEEKDLAYDDLTYSSSNNREKNNKRRNNQQGDDK